MEKRDITERQETVYLAGPIDKVSSKRATGWRKKAAEVLESHGYKVLDPTSGKNLNLPGVNDHVYTPEQIVEADLKAIDEADIVIVDWQKPPLYRRLWNFITTGHSDPMRVGTSMEVMYAHRTGKFIFVFGTMRKGYWIRYHVDNFFYSLDDVLKIITDRNILIMGSEIIVKKGHMSFKK